MLDDIETETLILICTIEVYEIYHDEHDICSQWCRQTIHIHLEQKLKYIETVSFSIRSTAIHSIFHSNDCETILETHTKRNDVFLI